MNEPILQVKNLSKHFKVESGFLQAVDGLNFDIYKGETFGLVGESGCGKSTAGRTILRLYEPTSGEAIFEGQNIYDLSPKEMKEHRKEMQMIFQDPYASLDPRMTFPGPETQIHHLRRAHLRLGRLHSGASRESSERRAKETGPHPALYRPRPFHGALHFRPRRGHVSGQAHGSRYHGRLLQQSPAPLHESPPFGHPHRRSRRATQACANRTGRRRAEPHQHEARLPLCGSLPLRRRYLPRKRPRNGRNPPRPIRGLL